MRNLNLANRLAVCSWSLQARSPQELARWINETGLKRVQLALDPLRENAAVWGCCRAVLEREGIRIVSGMFGCVGEDYSSLESIRQTGGIGPDATWEQNWRNAQVTATMASQMGLKLVTFHAGFMPHDEQDPAFLKLLRRLGELADIFRTAGLTLGLETGQETASALVQFLKKLGRPNVGVNFDPANMILYDKGDPIQALKTLGPWIRQVHIKDAVRTKVPGTWGAEVAAGTGQVEWQAFFAALREVGFTGDLVIEREAGNQRVADICTAREMVEKTIV